MKTRIVIDTRADGQERVYVEYHSPGWFGRGTWCRVTKLERYSDTETTIQEFDGVAAAKVFIDQWHAAIKANAEAKIVKTTYEEYP